VCLRYNLCNYLPFDFYLLCPYGTRNCIVLGAEGTSNQNMYKSHNWKVSGCSTKADKHSDGDDRSKRCLFILYFVELKFLCVVFFFA